MPEQKPYNFRDLRRELLAVTVAGLVMTVLRLTGHNSYTPQQSGDGYVPLDNLES